MSRKLDDPATVREVQALAERVRVLESSICRCGDCVMHRDKARHGKAKHLADAGDMIPTDPELPAWRRAKVGDRVEISHGGETIAAEVSDADDGRLDARITVWDSSRSSGCQLVQNNRILSILPLEPAALVQDAPDAPVAKLLPCPFCGRSDLTILDVKSEEDGRPYARAVFCRDCHAWGRHCWPIGWAESDQAAAESWNGRAPQTVTIDWNTALDTYYGKARAPLGTASDGLMAVLQMIPNLVIEE